MAYTLGLPRAEEVWSTLRTSVLGTGGMEALTDVLTDNELTSMVWSAELHCEELSRNKLAASADAFTHLGGEMGSGGCIHGWSERT